MSTLSLADFAPILALCDVSKGLKYNCHHIKSVKFSINTKLILCSAFNRDVFRKWPCSFRKIFPMLQLTGQMPHNLPFNLHGAKASLHVALYQHELTTEKKADRRIFYPGMNYPPLAFSSVNWCKIDVFTSNLMVLHDKTYWRVRMKVHSSNQTSDLRNPQVRQKFH